mgnify:CR=1 FL=1
MLGDEDEAAIEASMAVRSALAIVLVSSLIHLFLSSVVSTYPNGGRQRG